MDSRYFPLNTILTPHLGYVQRQGPAQSDEVGGPVAVEDDDSIGEADLDTDCIHRPL